MLAGVFLIFGQLPPASSIYAKLGKQPPDSRHDTEIHLQISLSERRKILNYSFKS